VVPDRVIAQLEAGWEGVPLTTDAPVNGDRVMIEDGAFEGLEAVWCEPDGTKRGEWPCFQLATMIRISPS
jgi:transcriptional antiterminator RfaH